MKAGPDIAGDTLFEEFPVGYSQIIVAKLVESLSFRVFHPPVA
jgi:hypothetical protein